MPEYTTKLLDKHEVAEGTMSFHVEKPAGFDFKPGQSADLTMLNPPENDEAGNIRTFSIASAPSENSLMFATRLRDTAFKRSLRGLPAGAAFKLEGPSGGFNLHKNTAKPGVFLAGGIGITPFMSMIREAAHGKDAHQLYMFYSNRRPEDAAFLQELATMPQKNPNFHLIATMAEMEKSRQNWDGERGFINAAMLQRYLPSLTGPIFYVAGPPGMVAAMREMLTKAGVDEDDIRTEDFPGY